MVTKTTTETTTEHAITVRVLVDNVINGVSVPAGRAAVISVDQQAGLISGGIIDDNDEAVAYALSAGDLIDTTITE